jgi:O-antigen/teichoic acid export membrane protein
MKAAIGQLQCVSTEPASAILKRSEKPDSTDTAIEDRNLQPLEKGRLVNKAASGAAALIIRQCLVYGSNIAGGVIIARLLTPEEFGFYGIVLFFMAFLNVFGGTGFAANLIRTEEHPSLTDFRAVFTGQQILVAVVFLCVWIASPWLATHYQMHRNGISFFRLMGLSLVLTSLMVVSQVLMERELAFGKLAVVEVAQALAFNFLAIVLAWRGVGVLSFAIALAVRAGCGALLSNIIEPWAIGWLWDTTILKRHLRFGLALQAGQFISLAKDSITPVFVGLYLGSTKMGYITWAGALASYPVMILMPMQRLYLPFFARLQADRAQLRHYASLSVWMANAIAAPLIAVTFALANPITILIFGSKWLVALPLFYCLSVANVMASGSFPMLGLLNAVGRSHVTLTLSLSWMIGTWVLGVPLMMKFGVVGFGIAVMAVQLINLGLYRAVWQEVSLEVLPTFWPSWPIAILIGILMFTVQWLRPIRTVTELVGVGLAGVVLYAATLVLFFPGRTRSLAKFLRATRL